MDGGRRQAIGLFVLLAIWTGAPGVAQAPKRAPAATTRYFSFHSDFATNLNDALIAAGLARGKGKGETFGSEADAACLAKTPRSVRAGWDAAVDYYTEIVSPASWTAREQYLIRMHLAGFDQELKDEAARRYAAIAGSLRTAAAPAYEACRWAAQDARNRTLIEELTSMLAAHEEKIGARLEERYRKKWETPIPVDIVETVNWAGATSTVDPPHLLVSTSYQGPAALEAVFHEASHVLMRPADPVRQALERAAQNAGMRLPGDLWHVVLFYTTGQVVREALKESGISDYTPMLYGIFERGTWTAFQSPVETTWQPYVDGKRPLADAAADLIAALPKPTPAR